MTTKTRVLYGVLTGAVAASIISTSAMSADLGGDCCADLEERVAELEATTARKGNRKVSLTVSGWVNEAVMFWDDGFESNVYQTTNMVAQTRFRFTGSAKIDNDWSAGYLIELGVAGSRSDGVDQNNDDFGAGVGVRHSAWFLESKRLGKLTVGQTSTATDNVLDAHVANIGYYWSENGPTLGGAFYLRTAGGGFGPRLNAFMGGNNIPAAGTDPGQIGEGGRMNVVRYDTPSIAGFMLSGAYGEDDQWDVALRYAGEFNGLKLAMNVGYQQWRDGNNDERNCVAGTGTEPDRDCEQFGIWGGMLHAPTGLFVEAGYGIRWDNNVPVGYDDSSTQWFVVAGIERKFIPLGKTTFFGEYQRWDVGLTGAAVFDSSNMRAWGLGMNQSIDAAAMDLYVQYTNYDADSTTRGVVTDYKSFNEVMAGGRIQF